MDQMKLNREFEILMVVHNRLRVHNRNLLLWNNVDDRESKYEALFEDNI